MFQFIKKIFSHHGQKRNYPEVTIDNLDEWISEKAKPFTEEMNIHVKELFMQVSEEMQRTRLNLQILENARLQNPDIPFKAKQYMEGNRKSYVRAISSFLGRLEINNMEYEYLLKFCSGFDDLMNELNKDTLRSYSILQEFFANEAGDIANNLKKFDAIFGQMRSALSDDKIVSIMGIHASIKDLKSKENQAISFGVELKNAQAGLKLAEDELASSLKQMEQFKKGSEYLDFMKLKEEKKSKLASFKECKEQVLQSFSALERALRKYSHTAFEHEELILSYVTSPIETLSNDKELKILAILEGLKSSLSSGRLQIDEKKKEKSLEEIKKLGREFLEQFLAKSSSFRQDMEKLENDLKKNGASGRLSSLLVQIGELELRINSIKAELEGLKSEAQKSSDGLNRLKEQIEHSIGKVFGDGVIIQTGFIEKNELAA